MVTLNSDCVISLLHSMRCIIGEIKTQFELLIYMEIVLLGVNLLLTLCLPFTVLTSELKKNWKVALRKGICGSCWKTS